MAPYTPEPLTAAHVPAKETTERLIWEEHIFSPVCDKLQDEFIDPIAEQALTAAVIHKPTLCFEFLVILAPDVFATEAATWREVALAIEADQPPLLSAPWRPTTDPQATAQHLADLYQRRLLAAAQERLAQALYDDTTPASTLAVLLEEEALPVQAALRTTAFRRLQWASDLLPEVLAEAAERRRQWEETGIPVQGLSTGITYLDDLLNGLNEGLYLLGGPPGMGKTTLAGQQQWRQLARQAALRGKQVSVLEPAAYVGHKDVSAAWVAGVLAVGVGPTAATVGGEVLATPKHLRESWAERVAIMITDGGLAREEAERLAWVGLQVSGTAW